jgi:hypothetical protein
MKGKIDVLTPFGNMKLSINKTGRFTCLKKDDRHNKVYIPYVLIL